VASGCATAPTSAPVGAPNAQRDQASRAPKILTLAIVRPVETFVSDFGGTASISGADKVPYIVHDQLVVANDKGAYVSQLADQVSVERGTWRLNPDGTMETVWRLRPSIKWHDGTPFTSEDMLFTYTVFRHPEIPGSANLERQLMASASAPDPLTFVIQWSKSYADADRGRGLIPLPRHLLAEVFEVERGGLVNSARFNQEFVGLGPYRLSRWEPGSHIEFARFDAYYQGRPPLDGVVLRFGSDTNAMVASILAGAVDVLLPVGVDVPSALEVARRWDGTGNRVTFDFGTLRHLEIQFRPEQEVPRHSTTSRQVRQALFHAIDRKTLNDVVTEGVAPVADTWFPTTHELRPQLEASIPQFPFDLGRAQQLLGQAGWTRGPDGLLVHQATGDRFEMMLYASQVASAEKEQNSIADGWKGVGVQPSFYIIAAALAGDRGHRAKLPGMGLNGYQAETFYTDTLNMHSRNLATAANRWSGRNRKGYVFPRADEILDRMAVTILPAERLALHRDLLQDVMTDVPMIPLYYNVDPVLAVKSVRGIREGNIGTDTTWNIFEWDKEG
jgi:peptide/nickel transport system substrate-binding protein